MPDVRRPLHVIAALACLVVVACEPRPPTAPAEDGLADEAVQAPAEPLVCPPMEVGGGVLPGTNPEHEELSYWLDVLGARYDLDATLLDVDDARALDASNAARPAGHHDLLAPVDVAAVLTEVDERLAWVRERLADERYVTADGSPMPDAEMTRMTPPAAFSPSPSLHAALAVTQVRCAPISTPYYTPSLDLRFDRNRCSALRPQEPVMVLGSWPGGGRLVRARYTMGWIDDDAPLSPAVEDPEVARAIVEGARWRALRDTDGVAAGTLLAALGDDPTRGVMASAEGVRDDVDMSGADFAPTRAPITRRAVLERAFALMGAPYGWGGTDGGRDCSRFVMDVFDGLGVRLPRFSALQADAGSFSIDVSAVESEADRLLLLDAAARRGVVLLHFPGHIMLYLGRDADGTPMAIHSFAEYLVPCDDPSARAEGRTETLRTVDRVSVTTLALGRDTSRSAFIQRLTRLTVIGEAPGEALQALATRRPPAPLRDGEVVCEEGGAALFVSPRTPNAEQTLRAIATSPEDPGARGIVLVDPDGRQHTPALRRLGGPPWALVAEVPSPEPGTWRVYFGEHDRALACATAEVRQTAPSRRSAASGPAWEVTEAWDGAYEDLYSAWVEALFDYPIDEDLTWTSLHELLRNDSNNLLYNHFSSHGDERIDLTPDCADLPYFLRAYFAWRMGLPFGYRSCGRGSARRAPTCEGLTTNLTERERDDEVEAFERFAVRGVRNGVHSGSARTLPGDDETDWYPVQLSRENLRPGTMYADPYGHLLVVARWVPQGLDDYGVLIAADAQPDATVGRRRFWRGSFLFTSQTDVVGAGFKAFRPLVWRAGALVSLDNDDLDADQPFSAWGLDQYAEGDDGFYERVEAMINPRPLDAWSLQASLVDAFEESVARRVNSVDNGERWIAENRRVMEMPTGTAIFQTSGPWEDFSTPSRDMRLLISLDTVLGFPDVVRRAPERFGLEHAADLDAEVDALRARLRAELAQRSFDYTRSDGSTWTVTLADLVDRAEAMEMAYNPNDCAEIRWGASPGTEEYGPCSRNAPDAQRARMVDYRPWFAERRRPAR